jgi:phosphatidylinositol alpha-mannosyltransferase
MKIALVCPYDYAHPGGVAAHVSQLEHHFTRMGHCVKILAPYSGNKDILSDNGIVASSRVAPIPAGGSISRISLSPLLPSRVKTLLRRGNFDIVHIHEPVVPLLSVAAVYFSKSVNVGTFHACHNTPRGYRFCHPFLKGAFERLDGKIAVSQPARDFVAKYLPGEYRIIPNGVDFEHFAADALPIEQFCDGKLNILFVGRLEKRKGLGYLIGAYGRVKRQFPNTRLIVVGPGTRLRRNYAEKISRMKLKDVVFAGRVSYADLPRYYHAADIFCAPATGEESFGIVLLEAMAAGKPIIASSIGGYASVVNDGVEGLLVPPKDEGALAQAIFSLFSDATLRQQMGARGRAKAEEYRWERVARMVLNYYSELLVSRPGGRAVDKQLFCDRRH